MAELDDFYSAVGSNAQDIISRLGGDATMVKLFLSKFPSDKSIDTLRENLNAGETELAFRAAHTLKGLCANLGLQTLFDKASTVTEMLRGGDIEAARLYLPALEQEYTKTIAALKLIGIGNN